MKQLITVQVYHRMTGEGYYYGLTFMDGVTAGAAITTTHHLMSCFEYASAAQLKDFYDKLDRKFDGLAAANINNPARWNTEYEIVGKQPDSGQTSATDTTASSSPYIYNCSIRSEYGLCGIFANGDNTDGFKSVVIAQYTGVSLQKDMSCWQRFDSGWKTPSYSEYIAQDPNGLRMVKGKRSFHIRAVNKAVIQEVSVFAIGQACHHWKSGGELTITNSNSNFGLVSALSEGYNKKHSLKIKGLLQLICAYRPTCVIKE